MFLNLLKRNNCNLMKKIKIELKKKFQPDAIFDFISSALKLSMKQYSAMLSICSKEPVEEAIHDFRVSIRRLISQTDLAEQIYPSNYITVMRNSIKKQLKLFSPLRDTQVQLMTVNKLRRNFPELNFFYYDLLAQEHTLITSQTETIRRFDIAEFEGFIFFYLLDFKRYLLEKRIDEQSIFAIIDDKFQSALSAKCELNIENLETYHKFRIAFKKFRYSLESVGNLLDLDVKLFKALGRYQTQLGEIQDSEVLLSAFSEYVERQKENPPEYFANAMEHLHNNRLAQVEKFIAHIDNIHLFWREAPLSK